MNKVRTIRKDEDCESLFVLGDIHGDFRSLDKLVSKAKRGEMIITLGDYTDRGTDGIAVIDYIKRLQQERRVIPLKGNPEDYYENGELTFNPCDLPSEAREKRGSWIRYFDDEYTPFVKNLYIAAIIPGKLLFVQAEFVIR